MRKSKLCYQVLERNSDLGFVDARKNNPSTETTECNQQLTHGISNEKVSRLDKRYFSFIMT